MQKNNSKEHQEHNLTINIKVISEHRYDFQTSQLLTNIPLSKVIDDRHSINLKLLLSHLNQQYNVIIENKEIYFYLQEADIFVNCGVEPLNQEIKITVQEYQGISCLTLKLRELHLTRVHKLMTIENSNVIQNDEEDHEEDAQGQKNKCRRTKQRRIGYIIEKVIEWRRYYSGTSDQKNQHFKFSLDEAATQVNISKKSLDDYLFQIRFGFKYGFNFNEHYNQKVGVLRDFVRQQKRSSKNQNKNKKKKIKEEEESSRQ